MALKATVYKVELSVSDIDRGYYDTHQLTLAQHPSETTERLMVRLTTFALFADERLEFTRGLSTDDEADLWERDYNGEVLHWISLGQPDEKRVKKALSKSQKVTLVGYNDNSFSVWWEQNKHRYRSQKRLTVLQINSQTVKQLDSLVERTMRLQATIQDGILWLGNDKGSIEVIFSHIH